MFRTMVIAAVGLMTLGCATAGQGSVAAGSRSHDEYTGQELALDTAVAAAQRTEREAVARLGRSGSAPAAAAMADGPAATNRGVGSSKLARTLAVKSPDDPTGSNPIDGGGKFPTVKQVSEEKAAARGHEKSDASRGQDNKLLRNKLLGAVENPTINNPIEGAGSFPTPAALQERRSGGASREVVRDDVALRNRVLGRVDNPLVSNPLYEAPARTPVVRERDHGWLGKRYESSERMNPVNRNLQQRGNPQPY